MYTLHEITLVLLAALLDFAGLLVCYGAMRFLHIAVRQVVVFIGILLLCVCGMLSVLILTNSQTFSSFGILALTSNVLGGISFLVAIYAVSQWTVRGWYVMVKRRAMPILARRSRDVLLFLREQHSFFGWIVLATATAHALYFLPVMMDLPLNEVLRKSGIATGIVAWGMLIFLVVLGLWIENMLKRRRLVRRVRYLHVIVALAFLCGFIVHFAFR